VGDTEVLGRRLQGGQHDGDLVELLGPTGAGTVVQAGDAGFGEAALPLDHRRLGRPRPGDDLAGAATVTGEQHDPRPLHQPGRHCR
jgi:hypothetical protein